MCSPQKFFDFYILWIKTNVAYTRLEVIVRTKYCTTTTSSHWFVTLYYKLLPAVRSSSKYGCRQSCLLYSISIRLTGGGGGGDVAYVQQMKFIEGNRCWYKLQLPALHMHLLEQIQSYIERTSLGWGKFGVTSQVQGHCQDHPMSHQGHSQSHI